MGNFDTLKLSVEAATGGKNTVLLDDMGMPGIYVVVPKFKLSDVIDGAPQDTHPAFIVDGEEKDMIHVSKYQNIVMNDRAYSLPMKDPKTYVNFDQAETYCRNKGRGFHLMTNAEWAAIALWCKKNNTMPRGNNNYGQDHAYPHEKGVGTYFDGNKKVLRVATGSGPATWAHDWTNEGVFDMSGNVNEWAGGLRLKDGEIQIIPNNNAATGIIHSPTSSLWKAIMPDGSLVEPGTTGTLKYDYVATPATGGKIQLTNILANQQQTEDPYAYQTFETLTAKSGVNIPMVLKSLGLFPVDASCGGDNLYMRNLGERLPLRGGYWHFTSAAGVFDLDLTDPRALSTYNVGFRSAFVSL